MDRIYQTLSSHVALKHDFGNYLKLITREFFSKDDYVQSANRKKFPRFRFVDFSNYLNYICEDYIY